MIVTVPDAVERRSCGTQPVLIPGQVLEQSGGKLCTV